MRIVRTILLLTGGMFLLPSPPESETTVAAQGPATTEMIGSAIEAVSDAASFCQRRPGVCHTAGYVAARLEAKAKYSVRLLYEWANEASQDGAAQTPDQTADADRIVTGSTTEVAAREAAASQSTLTIEDLIPEWRGPTPPV
jgi:Family of unknown function (DUF5330)